VKAFFRLRRPRSRPVTGEQRQSGSPLCIVYGNCQAEAIRVLLDNSPSFRACFRTQPIRAVHTVDHRTIPEVRKAVASASLIVSHPVRDGYHGFPVGSEEILASAGEGCRRVTVPALYYDGLYPFHVYVRGPDGRAPAAPLSVYHDLRIIYCAARGWDLQTSLSWWREFVPSPEGVRQVAAGAREHLCAHEAELDVHVAPLLTAPDLHADSFLTVNHPTNAALDRVVAGVHAHLGLTHTPSTLSDELLGELRAPLEPAVVAALGLTAQERRAWQIKGTAVTQEDLLGEHLAWYAGRRELVDAGAEQNAARMRQLGLAA
jgi:hypothetical protein